MIPAWFDHKDVSKGIFISEFCEIMQKHGTEVTLLYLNFFNLKQIKDYFFKKKPSFNFNYKVETINVLNLKSKILFFLSNKFILRCYYAKVRKQLSKRWDFDLIHVQSLCNNTTPFITKRFAEDMRIKYIVTEHYSSFHLSKGNVFQPYLDEAFVKDVASKASFRTAVSKAASMTLKNYFACEFIPIFNFINEKCFSSEPKQKKNDTFTFLIVAPLESHKGVTEVIEAFNSYNKVNNNCCLTIVGKGSQSDSIKSIIRGNPSVSLIPSLDREGIINLMDASHCLISASDYETFGLTIAEASLRGLPVITTKSGGPEELINELNGILIEKTDKKKHLVNAIQYMMNNYSSFSKDKIREDAMQRYNENKIVESYIQLYKMCNNNNK